MASRSLDRDLFFPASSDAVNRKVGISKPPPILCGGYEKKAMYDFLYKLNRTFTAVAALVMLLGLVFTPFGTFIGLDSKPILAIFGAVICGAVLLDRKLEKLMMAESWKASLGVDLDAEMDKLFQQEKDRRRKEGKSI